MRRLYLFDDPVARGWIPLALTRPAGEILFGALLLRERIERATGLRAEGYLGSAALHGFREGDAPPVIGEEVVVDSPTAILSTRYVPPLDSLLPIGSPGKSPRKATQLVARGIPVGWLLPPGAVVPIGDSATVPAEDHLEVPGEVLDSPWELVARNSEQLLFDLPALFPGEGERSGDLPAGLQGVERIGSHSVTCEDGVEVDPLVVLDTREGPIHLARGVRVRPFTHLRGPAYIGEGTTLLGGTYERLSAGSFCKLRGEISESVVLGYSNKAHDGYLGHSLIGRWVNLGAYTTNSDLKNNYGRIRVATDGGEAETGLLKMGVFLGDHVKTGIGTRLGAGTCLGAGANVFGPGMPPKWVPPFTWWDGKELVPYRLDAFLTSAERAMARREVDLPPEQRALFARIWGETHPANETASAT